MVSIKRTQKGDKVNQTNRGPKPDSTPGRTKTMRTRSFRCDELVRSARAVPMNAGRR